MEKLTAKNLEGKEFEIVLAQEIPLMKKEHQPEILILPFPSFGIGTRLKMEPLDKVIGEEYEVETEEGESWGVFRSDNDAIVTKVSEKNGEIIIEAETQIRKEEKKELVNKIIKKVNFDNALNENIFIEILSNVFTENQLEKFLKQEDIEILLFKGLMYLKAGDKAYRL